MRSLRPLRFGLALCALALPSIAAPPALGDLLQAPDGSYYQLAAHQGGAASTWHLSGVTYGRLVNVYALDASGAMTAGAVSIGFIPTCVHHLLPRVLEAMRAGFPGLQVNVISALSGELAAAVVRRELDYALVTTPIVEIPELDITPIASEHFHVIGPAGATAASDAELLRSLPYIAFNKRTWVGQYIAARLQHRGIHIQASIEIDSLEAIENLVADGFGVAIVPQRLHAQTQSQNLLRIPFGNPPDTRQLTLIRHLGKPRSRLDDAIKTIFLELPNP